MSVFSFDFKDGADSSNEYLYDANGNMIQDKNKGIAQIQYNHLNMPTRITYENGNMIDYLYSASGVKLEVTHTTNKLLMVNSNIGNRASAKASLKTTDLLTIDEPALAGRTNVQSTAASNLEVQTTDYINGYILENGTLSQIQLNGGYMTEDSQGKAVYHFYLHDHQGNNRVVVNGKTLAVEQVNHYYPYGGLFAESTGGEMQAFKYNGKELDRVCGLNWYDHGARHNDAAIGRWHCIDPLAEKYYSISPYVYCADNPVMFVDLSGMAPDSISALEMVKDSYDAKVGQIVNGWTCESVKSYKNGLEYVVYSHLKEDKEKEYSIAFVGTESDDSNDWITDKEQYMGEYEDPKKALTSQYGVAVGAAEQFQRTHVSAECTLLGHSLGGGLATVASMGTGYDAITFNPAGVHDNTITGLELDPSQMGQITNYVVSGEAVSLSNINPNVKTYGTTILISPRWFLSSSNVITSLMNHKINNVKF